MKNFFKGLGLTILFIAMIFAIPFIVVLWPVFLALLILFIPGLIIGVCVSKNKEIKN